MGTPDNIAPAPADSHLGKKAVELGLITEMQLADVLARLTQEAGSSQGIGSLGDALVRFGLLTERQIDALADDTASIRKRFGKYRITRQLGRGGMGVVYEAIDSDLGRSVALKMLLSGPSADPKEAALDEERFVREARLSANLPRHPGIVGVYESGVLEGRRYIAMEYIEGKVFSDWCAKATGSLRTQVTVLREVALAVDHANRHGIIHRDLKPANVLVDARGKPHVTDFGLARQMRQDASMTLTGGGKVMGTPSYISPEQASGRKDVDRRTDVWALGIMLYELLAGRTPFQGETPVDIMMKAVQNPVPPPSAVRTPSGRTFDKTIERICLKALAKEPGQRYPTAKKFADDLTKWLKGETVEITTAAPKRPVALWVGVAAAVAVVAIVIALIPSGPSREKIEAERKDKAEGLVVKGQRYLNEGHNEEALAAFVDALKLDEENRAALKGKLEAGRRIAASHAAQAPSPAPPPVAPPGPAGPTPQDAMKKATEFARANPKDVEGQIRGWQEAQKAVAGTPLAAEAARELEAALGKRIEARRRELTALDRTLEGFRETESFGRAREALASAAERYDDADWTGSIQSRGGELTKAIAAAYESLKGQALELKRKDRKEEVEGLRKRIARWGVPDLPADLDDALAKVVPVAPAAPVAPEKPPGQSEPPKPAGIVELPVLRAHDSGVCAMAFSPDGKLLVTSSFDNLVRLWDVPGRSKKADLVQGLAAPSVSFSPDGKWIAAGLGNGTIRIWDAPKLQMRTLSGHNSQAIGIGFSPDSRYLASASTDGTARLWDPAAGAQKAQLDGHPKGAMSLAWSPDGKLLAVGCAEPLVKIWEVPSGRERARLTEGLEAETMTLAFSSNGKMLATGGPDMRVVFWEVESGRRRTLTGHEKEIRGIAGPADGPWIASASRDGTLRIWDAASGELRAVLREESGFYGVAFSRKGDILAGGTGGGGVRMWDLSALRK